MQTANTTATKRNKYKKKYITPPHRFVDPLPLHKNQQTIWNQFFSGKYRALVINAGRRFGKSTVCMAIAIEVAVNYGKRVWWVGKTYRDAGKQWRDAKQLLSKVYTNKSEQDRRMEFYHDLPDGTQLRGEIAFRSADTPDNLRGDGLDLLILDEAAFQSQEVWKVLRPALADHQGDVIFISTPNGHNWFYSLFQRGIKENRERYPTWWSKHYTSYDNPYVDPKELDLIKSGELTETEFRIEHMAEFIDDIGKVFSNVYACAISKMQEPPTGHGEFAMGIDLARKHDATVVSVIDVTTNTQVYGERFVGLDWELQKAKLAAIIKAWNPQRITADASGVGEPVVEDLQRLVPYNQITPFVLTPMSKPPLIQKLAIQLQNKKLKILDPKHEFGQLQANELLAYEIKRSKDEMRWVYSAPPGGKDDTVIALALALYGIEADAKTLITVHNPFYPSPAAKAEEKAVPRTSYAKESRELKKRLLESLSKQNG